MRNTTLVTSYIQAIIFVALGLRCFLSWRRQRDRRSAHLAWAAGLFGASSLLGAITTTFIDATKGEAAPRWEGVLSGILVYLSVWAFLLFLSDFIKFPAWVHGLIIIATGVNIVLHIIERPDIQLDFKTFKFVPIPGVDNPISYRGYISYVLIYLAVAFGVLAVAFLVYGFRSKGLAQFRMISIGAGFLLFAIALGLLPRLVLDEDPNVQTVRNLLNIVRYVALATGPLLLIGFSPPKFIRSRFPEPMEATASR